MTERGSSVWTRNPEALAIVAMTWTSESCLKIHSPPRLHFKKWDPCWSASSPQAQVEGMGIPSGRPRRKRTAVENSGLEKQQPGIVCGVERKAAAPMAAADCSLIISGGEEECMS